MSKIILAPYQTYGKQCVSANCDSTKGLVCRTNGTSKTCQCPSGNWFWYNSTKCRMLISKENFSDYILSKNKANVQPIGSSVIMELVVILCHIYV